MDKGEEGCPGPTRRVTAYDNSAELTRHEQFGDDLHYYHCSDETVRFQSDETVNFCGFSYANNRFYKLRFLH